jgi:hypothetical protein
VHLGDFADFRFRNREWLVMLKNPGSIACGMTLSIACLSAGLLSAQEAVLSQFYGSGVHNFYERDYFQAMSDLSAAIDGGTRDPRAYYYRGLVQQRLGDAAAAGRDMQKGAELESADVNQFYPVGKALERVQGSQRLALERYRALARAQAHERQIRRDAARYEQLRRAESQVLRQAPLGPPPAPLRPSPVAPAAAVEPAERPATPTPPQPLEDKPAVPTEPSPFDVPAEDEPAEEKPADAAPAVKPEDDPFGDAAATDEAEMKADAPAEDAKEEENPFLDEPK